MLRSTSSTCYEIFIEMKSYGIGKIDDIHLEFRVTFTFDVLSQCVIELCF